MRRPGPRQRPNLERAVPLEVGSNRRFPQWRPHGTGKKVPARRKQAKKTRVSDLAYLRAASLIGLVFREVQSWKVRGYQSAPSMTDYIVHRPPPPTFSAEVRIRPAKQCGVALPVTLGQYLNPTLKHDPKPFLFRRPRICFRRNRTSFHTYYRTEGRHESLT